MRVAYPDPVPRLKLPKRLARRRGRPILSYTSIMDTNGDKGQITQLSTLSKRNKYAHIEDFVLEKSIFSNVFEKDIQRVFIYKKTERLAKAIHLISPAFADSVSLKNRLDAVAVGLIDAGTLSTASARTALARELLALSSILGVARASAMLSTMNVELISREAQLLLQEVAAYEEPRIFLEDAPTLAQMMKHVPPPSAAPARTAPKAKGEAHPGKPRKTGQDIPRGRQEIILSVIKDKGSAGIKDISMRMPQVSEKTIQRELQGLVASGLVLKSGERRWSTYSLA